MTDRVTRFTAAAGLGLFLGLAGWTAPAAVSAQAVTPPVEAIDVTLDLYRGDKNSAGFSDALTAAINGDERFEVVTTLPPDGMKITMTDALVPQHNDDQAIAAYDVVLKLGNGKFIAEEQGYCDLAKLTMCGRVVAQDSFDAYTTYMAHHKAG